jgi:glycosyltransferase involved in cell wall biosynthesis
MKISVVITTHNRPSYLRKVLASYEDQSRPPDQLVIADDGSGAATRAVVDEFRARAPYEIVHAWQPHAGSPRLSHVRNLATRATTGDYLIYTDGDCVAPREFIADHERLARPGWFVQGKRSWVKYKAIDSFTGRESRLKKLRLCATGGLTKPHWLLHLPTAVENKTADHIRSCNLAVFRDDIVRINGWNEQFLGFWRQDSEFALRLLRSGVRRRDALFSAILFHLEHEKELVAADLDRNDRLLKAARTAPVYAVQGLLPE